MKLGDEAFEALCGTLREEATEQVERIGAALLEIEQGTDADRTGQLLEQSFREAHNLKGAAGSLGFSLASKLAHALESVLTKLRKADPQACLDAFDSLHQGLSLVDHALAAGPGVETDAAIDRIIAQLERCAVPPAPAPAGSAVPVPAKAAAPSPATSAVPTPSPVAVPAPPTRHTRVDPPVGSPEAAPDPPRTAVPLPARAAPAKGEESLRVSMRKLGALMAQVGELLAARLRTDQRLAELRGVLGTEEEILDQRTATLSGLRDRRTTSTDAYAQALLDGFEEEVAHRKQLVHELRDLVRAFESDALQSTILSGELQEDIRRIQTFPLSSVLDPLPRAVRNMAREVGKDAILKIEGAELELDKKVLEALRDPLNHLLRNAVDHGIEAPEVRVRAGKPQAGLIRIRAEHRGDSIAVIVADDGPGVDLQAVLARAVERGIVSAAEAEGVPEARLLDLLFAPGFTTRAVASSISGRGVGLNAVRSNIEELQGIVTVESKPGQGTTFSLVLPLTIYVLHALILRVGSHHLAMPISAIQRILRVRPSEVLMVEQSEAVVTDGRPLALLSLAALLGINGDDVREKDRLPVLVVGTGDLRCAVAVDEIVGDQTVLAKNFEPPLVRVRNFAGATVRGDGSVLLMLNPTDLMRASNAHQLAGSARLVQRRDADQRQARVLLVDDSLTTRSLERSVFEMAGFEVVAAADGAEALAILAGAGSFDVIVSDVSMPEISGFELCERIRKDDRHRRTPLVLVTAMASDEDRRRGLEAGADAYIAKQEFDHEVLVAKVNELMGRS